ncbi:MAG TPA: hypothetical protein VFY93_09945 [Planctomycetota bacterium]|nr:hypothetical protein [Planctomycetota bacterium]
MASGYFWSILAMMGAPFVVLGVVGAVIVRAVRRDRPSGDRPPA